MSLANSYSKRFQSDEIFAGKINLPNNVEVVSVINELKLDNKKLTETLGKLSDVVTDMSNKNRDLASKYTELANKNKELEDKINSFEVE